MAINIFEKEKYLKPVKSIKTEEIFNIYLVGFDNEFDQVLGQIPVFLVEERRSQAEVAHSAGSADTVHVLVDVRRKVEVDDMLHVRNVKTTSCNLKTKLI